MATLTTSPHQTATEVDGPIHVWPPKSWEARSVLFPAFLTPRLESLVEGKTRGLVFRRLRATTSRDPIPPRGDSRGGLQHSTRPGWHT